MNKKIFLIPVIALMCSCGVSYQETTQEDFNTKQDASQQKLLDKNSESEVGVWFDSVNIKGTIKTSESSASEKITNLNINYTAKATDDGTEWTNDAETSAIATEAEPYFYLNAGSALFSIELLATDVTNLKYYVADAGYKIEGSYTGTIDLGVQKANVSVSSLQYVFNEYALCTFAKLVSVSEYTGVVAKTVTQEVNVTITYAHK